MPGDSPLAAPPARPGPPSRADQIKRLIRRRYARVAGGGAFAAPAARRAREAGYPAAALSAVPPAVAEAFCGCGYGLEGIDLAGVRVAVDLGCGAGLDACLLARAAGGATLVIGMELTFAMLLHARQAAASAPRGSVWPVAGDMERLPLGDGIAELVVANASFNLAVDQPAAFAEAARILRPGGRLVCREMIRQGALPADLGQDPMGWNASLGGVMEAEALRAAVRAAGFERVKISQPRPFPPVVAIRLEAVRPGGRGG